MKCAVRLAFVVKASSIRIDIKSTGRLPVTNLPSCGKVVPDQFGDGAQNAQLKQADGPRYRGPFPFPMPNPVEVCRATHAPHRAFTRAAKVSHVPSLPDAVARKSEDRSTVLLAQVTCPMGVAPKATSSDSFISVQVFRHAPTLAWRCATADGPRAHAKQITSSACMSVPTTHQAYAEGVNCANAAPQPAGPALENFRLGISCIAWIERSTRNRLRGAISGRQATAASSTR